MKLNGYCVDDELETIINLTDYIDKVSWGMWSQNYQQNFYWK